MHSEPFIIDPRFNGPPGSGNGGYVCGVLATHIGEASETVLRAPPPLNAPLAIAREGECVTLRDGEMLLAEARALPEFALSPPPAPSVAEAHAASQRYPGLRDHRYDTCFVCGTARPAKDGLALFTGPVAGRDMVACLWRPGADLADAAGFIREEFIHTALDCPSYWALPHAGKPALLARMASARDGPLPRAGDTLIVAAWPLGWEGRKHRGASALYTAAGQVIARAEALWIEPRA